MGEEPGSIMGEGGGGRDGGVVGRQVGDGEGSDDIGEGEMRREERAVGADHVVGGYFL